MNYILFDGPAKKSLLPFTFTRPVADIRVGILTIREKWQRFLGTNTSTLTEPYLSVKYPLQEKEENILINASFLPNKELVTIIKNLKPNEVVFYNNQIVAFYANKVENQVDFNNYKSIAYTGKVEQITHTWDIFSKNKQALEADFELLTNGRTSKPIPDTVQVLGKENIFIEEGAELSFCTINATTGPVYIGKNAQIMEGVLIRGGLALAEGSVLKMGAKIYGPTTIGPYCKIGGEVTNSVIFGYSNKAHEGYLGNSVLGEWCNIGADSNTSNLKNNYAQVRLWSYETENFAKTGLQFCGLMMGDHSKCAINTMFNTGTVVGVSANIFGSGFPRNFIPSFSWGGASGMTTYQTRKAFEVAQIVMQRRGIELTEADKQILQHVFNETKKWRKD